MHILKIKILAPLFIFRHFETIIPFVSVTPHVVGNFYPLRISSPTGEKFPHGGVKLTPIFGVIITHRSITPLKLVYLPLRWCKFYSLKFTVWLRNDVYSVSASNTWFCLKRNLGTIRYFRSTKSEAKRSR